jgi:tRNA-binding protein
MNEITWNDFEQVELRVGTIVDVREFPEARNPAYIIHADFGEPIGVRKCSAQITKLYPPEQLLGMQIVGVVNFPPKQIGPITSQFLLTGFQTDQGVVICTPERYVPDGAKLC